VFYELAGVVSRGVEEGFEQEVTEQFQLFLIEKPDSAQGESVGKAIADLEAGQKP